MDRSGWVYYTFGKTSDMCRVRQTFDIYETRDSLRSLGYTVHAIMREGII